MPVKLPPGQDQLTPVLTGLNGVVPQNSCPSWNLGMRPYLEKGHCRCYRLSRGHVGGERGLYDCCL